MNPRQQETKERSDDSLAALAEDALKRAPTKALHNDGWCAGYEKPQA